tara:strand:- start:3335 stop:4990 length:1656 start_codon:yes stop_codon:yes gene_type:complete
MYRNGGRGSELGLNFGAFSASILMVDRFRINRGQGISVFRFWRPPGLLGLLAILVGGILPSGLNGQAPSAASYPSSATANAGMTSGLPDGLSPEQMQMMHVRTAAQSAEGSAAVASMARSADQSIEAQHQQRSIQSARELKAIKGNIAERMKWDRSSAQVNKVTSNDMSSWNTTAGNVKVSRDSQDPYLAALIEEEKIAMQEEGQPKKKGINWNPFKKSEKTEEVSFEDFNVQPVTGLEPASVSPPPAEVPQESSGGGFFSNLRVPGIGNSKNNKDSSVDVGDSEPTFISSSGSNQPAADSQASSVAAKPNTVVAGRSGAALVDGYSPSGYNPSAPQTVSFSESTVDDEKKPGLFSRFKSDGNGSTDTPSSSGGGGLFSFGKKKSNGTIDAGLFPDDAVSSTPTGGSLQGEYIAEDFSQDTAFAPSSTGDIVMPGESQKKGGFNFKVPKLSVPSIGKSNKSSATTPLTTINSAGTDYYLVSEASQFMVYGSDQMTSEVRALQPGAIVQMTKPGAQWASVRLPNGTEGIIQVKFLKAASAAQAGGQFSATGN